MIKLGDKVRFVNEDMQGVVTSIKGNTAGVTIEDDFEIPVLLSEVVKINDILNKPKQEEDKSITVKPKFVKVHHGIHIAFDSINDDKLDLKIHNSEADWLMVAVYENQQLKHKINVELESNSTLGTFSLEQFNKWPEFTFVITPINEEYKLTSSIVKKVKLNAKEFHASFKQCYFLGKQAYTIRLDSDVTSQSLKKLQEKDFTISSSAQKVINLKDKPNQVIDLHAENLVEKANSLGAQEILDIQINAFVQSLEMAHVHKMKSITFIHGVGNHFLKNKIKNYLSTQKNIVEKYTDASSLLYGGGATEVWLK
jgi:DNA-nicking Smr family endonuclease